MAGALYLAFRCSFLPVECWLVAEPVVQFRIDLPLVIFVEPTKGQTVIEENAAVRDVRGIHREPDVLAEAATHL